MLLDQSLMTELRTEAIDSAEDRLASLTATLEQFTSDAISGRDALAACKMDVHSIKSVAASFDMKPLAVICHRMEDYLFNINILTASMADDVQFIVDRMAECLDAFVSGRNIDVSAMVRELPAKGGFDVGEVSVADIEVMLVMAPGTATRIVTRELLECGYRMVNVASTLDALALIPSMRPDVVICSRFMPELSGVDLACALRAMPTTRSIPVALIASLEQDGDAVTDLPPDVPVLRKGEGFADDVAAAFVRLGIL